MVPSGRAHPSRSSTPRGCTFGSGAKRQKRSPPRIRKSSHERFLATSDPPPERSTKGLLMIIGIIVGAVVLAALLTAAFSVKIVREYQRIMLFRLGRALGTRGPGLVLINPITDRTSLIDLREAYLEIPRQTAITKDNAAISVDFIVFYKVIDAATTVLTVQNFVGAALNIAATTLRSLVGDMSLDDILSKREQMNAALRTRLDEVDRKST